MGRLAILIDADNIGASSADAVFAHAATLGTPSIKRAYGKPSAIGSWGEAAASALCELRPVGHESAAKNGTDIALAVDAMDILHERIVDGFVIVSNDRDFIPLASRLRASGKTVHAVCRRGDRRVFQAFDTVFELEPLQVEHPLVAAFRKVAGDRGNLSLAEAGKLLRQHAPKLIPTSGKSPLRRSLEQTGRFDFDGSGSAIRVRLRN